MFAITIELVIIVVLVVFNGVLAMSELAVVSSRKSRLQQRAEAGDAGARAALALANEPNRFLSTVQIGITMVGILAGAFGGATLAETLAARLEAAGLSEGYSGAAGVVIVVLGITYLSLIAGELVPKRLALQNPERVASLIAGPMRVLSKIGAPAVALLSLSTDLVLRVLGIKQQDEQHATEEEIRLMIQQSTEAGVFEEVEQEMVTSVFRLADRRVGELMTPRPNVAWVDIDDPLDVIWQEMSGSEHIVFPVCRGDLDTVLGVVTVKDVWTELVAGRQPDLTNLVHPALFVPEGMPVLRALELFKQSHASMALVMDEFGGTDGLLTLNDLLEAIVGDLPSPEEIADPRVVRREDGSWLLDGLLPIGELKDVLQLKDLPDEGDYQTLAGFVLLQMGRIPAPADHFVWDGMRFEVADMDGNRVDKVLVTPAPDRAVA